MEHCGDCLEHPGKRFVHGFGQAWYRAAYEFLRDNRDRFAAELVEFRRKEAMQLEADPSPERAATGSTSVMIGE